MDTLRISLFGRFSVRCGEETLGCLGAHKAQEMLCYLVLHRDRLHRREALINLLWPTNTATQSMKYFRHTLWQLRTAFDADKVGTQDDFFLIDLEWIRINPEASFWLDVAEFERACALVRGISGQDFEEHIAHVVREAIELYRGDLLDGCYQDWCTFERERLRQMYLGLLEKQMTYCETRGHHEAAIEYGLRALRCEPAHERTHRRLMRLYCLAGDRTSALRQYERCTAVLRQELDVHPSPRTLTLYESISSGRLADPGDMLSGSNGTTSDKTASTLYEALFDLEQLQANMLLVQSRLRETIRAVQVTLKSWDG